MIDSAFESLDGAIERTRQEYAEIEKKVKNKELKRNLITMKISILYQ